VQHHENKKTVLQDKGQLEDKVHPSLHTLGGLTSAQWA